MALTAPWGAALEVSVGLGAVPVVLEPSAVPQPLAGQVAAAAVQEPQLIPMAATARLEW